MSDIDPTRPTQTTLSQGGKLMYLQEENPCSLGEEKPYKLPQLDKKNSDLPCLHIAVAL
jgi:hypothetical protein